MTKEQFEIFKAKQNELYDKYENSTDPNAHELLNKEYEDFIREFLNRISTVEKKCSHG